MNASTQQLVRLVKAQAGESFRSAFCYDSDDWTALYVRSDIATDQLKAVVPTLAERARRHEPLVREQDYPGMGTHRASVAIHDEAVMIHFQVEEQSGIVVTLDTGVARNLSEFVAACERVLSPPQRRQ